MAKYKGRKGKIKVRQNVRFVHKNDKTRVSRRDTISGMRIGGRPPADIGTTFKVKLRKK